MTEPTTISLLEQHASRIANELKKSVGNDIEWREKQAEQWGFIRAHIESQSAFNDATTRWQKEHQDKDDDAVLELSDKIDARFGSVTSSLTTGQIESRYTLKELIAGAIAICVLVGGVIGFIGAWLSSGPKP